MHDFTPTDFPTVYIPSPGMEAVMDDHHIARVMQDWTTEVLG